MYDYQLYNMSAEDRWAYPTIWLPLYLRDHEDIERSYQWCFRAKKLPIPCEMPDAKTQLNHILSERFDSIHNTFESIPTIASDQIAPKGAAEDGFISYIQKNSRLKVYTNTRIQHTFYEWDSLLERHTVKKGEGFRGYYYPDLLVVDDTSKLVFDIEIDEPYSLVDGKPLHILWAEDLLNPDPYDNPDDRRNEYMVMYRVVVIRFAEEQVIKYPSKCLGLINEFIRLVVSSNGSSNIEYSHLFDGWSEDMLVERWTEDEAYEMAYNKYRDTYLNLPPANKATYTPKEGGISVDALTKAFEEAMRKMSHLPEGLKWGVPPQNDNH